MLLLITRDHCVAAELGIEADKAAILETIATETEAYFRQDYEVWKDQFVDAPYFMRIGYWEGYPNKVSHHHGFDTLRTEKKLQFEELAEHVTKLKMPADYLPADNDNWLAMPEGTTFLFMSMCYFATAKASSLHQYAILYSVPSTVPSSQSWLRSSRPATCGADIEVPDIFSVPPLRLVDRIPTPGAA